MTDPLVQLQHEHTAREFQRAKIRAPITVVTVLIVIASVITAVLIGGVVRVDETRYAPASPGLAVAIAVGGVIVAVLWQTSAQMLAEWDRAVLLSLGRFRRIRGPGFFMIVPILQSVTRVVDMRTRTTPFFAESILTKDTVPIQVDAIAFWHVWDSQKAVLEVENYYQAITMAIQTALRDIIGVHSLAEILAEREKISRTLQQVLESKAQAWGIHVNSIEIRDIMIPDNLKDALSKQAQAERELQARTILGQAEMEIAQKFAEASKGYVDNPVALQLRAMNIVYEGLKAGSSIMLVPSTVLDTMNLGSVAALGQSMTPRGSSRASVPPSVGT